MSPTEHEHHWIDAPEDETLWFCPSCGRKECRHGVEASDLCDECQPQIDDDLDAMAPGNFI